MALDVAKMMDAAVHAEALRAMLAQHAGVSSELPALEKSLDELEAETASFGRWAEPMEDVALEPTPQRAAEASHLLAGAIDATKLQRQIRELGLRASYAEPSAVSQPELFGGFGEDDQFETALKNRGDEVIVAAIEGAVEDALLLGDSVATETEEAAWDEAKARIFQDMGLKAVAYGGGGGVPQTQKKITSAEEKKEPPKVDKDAVDAGQVVKELNRTARKGEDMMVCAEFGTRAERAGSPAVSTWRLLYAYTREGKRVEDLAEWRAVVTAPARGGRRRTSHSKPRTWAKATRNAAKASAVPPPGKPTPPRATTQPQQPSQTTTRARAWLARGGRRFLEWQYKSIVEAKLRTDGDVLRAHVMATEVYDGADDAAKFVAWQRARHQLPAATVDAPRPRLSGEPAWPQIYVALRCGELRAAAQIAQSAAEAASRSTEFGRRVRSSSLSRLALTSKALEAHAAHDDAFEVLGWCLDDDHFAGSASSIVDAAALQLRDAVAGLEAAVDDDCVRDDDPYELVVLDVLTLGSVFHQGTTTTGGTLREHHITARPSNKARGALDRTAEDFIWRELWRSVDVGGTYDKTDLLATLKSWGPRHFDPDGRRPFQYANYLLLAGDAGAAVAYASRDAPKEALHLALALDAYGLLNTAFDLPAALAAYAAHVAPADPVLGLEYVAWLQHRHGPSFTRALLHAINTFDDTAAGWRSRQGPTTTTTTPTRPAVEDVSEEDAVERTNASALAASVVELILETRQLDPLLGKMDPTTGERSEKALGVHFPQKEVADALIALAARVAKARGSPEDAVDLFAIAGKKWWPDVVNIFVDQLAAVVAPSHLKTTADDDAKRSSAGDLRDAWLDRATRLAKHSIRDQLFQRVPRDLGHTFQLLLNLARFFDLTEARSDAAALSLLDELTLVPSTQANFATALDLANNLDPRLHALLADVLDHTMASIFHLYELARDGKAPSSNLSLAALRARASLLVTYAGHLHIPLPPEVRSNLSRYEQLML